MGIDHTATLAYGIPLTRQQCRTLLDDEDADDAADTLAGQMDLEFRTIGSAYSGRETYILGPKLAFDDVNGRIECDVSALAKLKALCESKGLESKAKWFLDVHTW